MSLRLRRPTARLQGVLAGLGVLLFATACGDAQTGTMVSVSVELKKSSYTSGEAVLVDVVFRNVSAGAILLNVVFNVFGDCELKLDVIAPSERQLQQLKFAAGRRPSSYLATDFRRLRTGETYAERIDLASWFELNETGLYRIAANYANRRTEKQPRDAWEGRLRSEVKTFEIR